jgi:hypothetical protein
MNVAVVGTAILVIAVVGAMLWARQSGSGATTDENPAVRAVFLGSRFSPVDPRCYWLFCAYRLTKGTAGR